MGSRWSETMEWLLHRPPWGLIAAIPKPGLEAWGPALAQLCLCCVAGSASWEDHPIYPAGIEEAGIEEAGMWSLPLRGAWGSWFSCYCLPRALLITLDTCLSSLPGVNFSRTGCRPGFPWWPRAGTGPGTLEGLCPAHVDPFTVLSTFWGASQRPGLCLFIVLLDDSK